MKTNICIALVIVFFSSFAVSATEQTVEDRLTKIEERIGNIEKMFAAIMQLKGKGDKKGKQAGEPTVKPPASECQVMLTDWNYKYTKGSSQQYYTISYTLTNKYEKGIKLIEGSLTFKDLLGTELYGIKITPDEKIAPNQTASEKGKYRVNQFMAHQLRMKNMNKNDIIAELEIRKLVFDDNSIIEL